MADNGKAIQLPQGIFWGQDIQRPKAIHPPPYIVPYLQGLATGLNGFAAQRRRSIEYYIQVFELDRQSFQERRDKRKGKAAVPVQGNRNRQPGDDGYMKPYNINKALTLELLMTCAMYRLLLPMYARSNCRLKYGWPANFAPRLQPDIMVNSDGFVFHVEVSAKIDMDNEYFSDELTGTLNHMVKHDVMWALLVTEWDYKKARNSQAYKEFNIKRQADLEGRHLIIMSIHEMAELSATLGFDAEFNSGKKCLDPAAVRELFEALHAAQVQYEGEMEKPKTRMKSKKKGKQKPAKKKKKKVDINLRDTWIKTTQRLLKGRQAQAPDPAGEP